MISDTSTKGKSNTGRKSLPAMLSASALGLIAIGLSGSTASANNATALLDKTSECLSGVAYRKKEDNYLDFTNLGRDNYGFAFQSSNQINGFSTESIGKNNTVVREIMEPTEQDSNLYNYIACYIDQINKNSGYITIPNNEAFSFFYKSAVKISTIPFKKAKVHLLPNNGVKFILKLDENLLLQVSQSMASDELTSSHVVFSLFENKKMIQSDIADIDNFVERAKSFMLA